MANQRKLWSYTINNYGEDDTMDPSLCDYLIEAHEMGEDGTPHIQGFCILTEGRRFNKMKELLPRAHLEPTKSTAWQNFLYCSKGDQSKEEWAAYKETGPHHGRNAEFQEWGTRPKQPGPSHQKKVDFTFQDALAAPTIREGMEIIKKRKARDYCLHGDSIERNLRKAKTVSYASKFLLTDFNRSPLDTSKSILLSGPSGTGKTQWALAHFKNPLLCSHIDKLKQLTPDHDGVVFDDMSFTHWPAESVIHLLDIDVEREIHVRYGTVTIPAYVKKIFTHNKANPFYTYDTDQEQIHAIERRLKKMVITTPLFGVDSVFPAAASLYDQMVGAHRADIPVYPMPERFPIHDACMPINDPDDDYDNEMNQID